VRFAPAASETCSSIPHKVPVFGTPSAACSRCTRTNRKSNSAFRPAPLTPLNESAMMARGLIKPARASGMAGSRIARGIAARRGESASRSGWPRDESPAGRKRPWPEAPARHGRVRKILVAAALLSRNRRSNHHLAAAGQQRNPQTPPPRHAQGEEDDGPLLGQQLHVGFAEAEFPGLRMTREFSGRPGPASARN